MSKYTAEQKAIVHRPRQYDTPPLVFLHVPRTAGTSIGAAIEARYPCSRKIKAYMDVPVVEGEWDFIYGHMTYGLHRQFPVRYTTIIREPVARLMSHYGLHQWQTGRRGQPSLTLDAFIDDPAYQNLQIRMVQDLAAYEIVGVHENLPAFAAALDLPPLPHRNGNGPRTEATAEQRRRIARLNAADMDLYDQAWARALDLKAA